MTIESMRARRVEIHERRQAILTAAGSTALTADQQTEYDALRSEAETLKTRIAEHEALATEARELSAPATRSEGAGAAGETRAVVGRTREGDAPFRNFGEQLRAIVEAAKPGVTPDPRLMRINEEVRVATGASTGVDSDGGFAVAPEFSQQIIGRLYDTENGGDISSRVNRNEISGNSLKILGVDETSRVNGSRFGGVHAYWASEAGSAAATKPKWRRMELELKKLLAFYYATGEMIDDAPAASGIVSQAFSEEIQFVTEDAFMNGTGAGQPQGVLASGALITVAIEGTQTIANTGTFIATNTAKMLARFGGRVERAVWNVDRQLLPSLYTATLGGTAAQPVYIPGGNIAGAPFGTLWGIPIRPVEYCAALGTVGDILLADWGWYMAIDKGGVRQDASMHVRFLYDEEVFRTIYRVDGQPMIQSPVTPKNGGATLSPFVALGTRS
jgi:HK97 family phage major capsid protein